MGTGPDLLDDIADRVNRLALGNTADHHEVRRTIENVAIHPSRRLVPLAARAATHRRDLHDVDFGFVALHQQFPGRARSVIDNAVTQHDDPQRSAMPQNARRLRKPHEMVRRCDVGDGRHGSIDAIDLLQSALAAALNSGPVFRPLGAGKNHPGESISNGF